MLGDPLVVGFTFVLAVMGPFLVLWWVSRKRKAAGRDVPRPIRVAVKLLGIATVLGAPLVIFAMGLGPSIQNERRHDELVRTGKQATALVTALHETGTVINRRPEVRVFLSVTPAGEVPFQSQAAWPFSVTDIQTYKLGTRVRVHYDPEDPSTVAVVGVVAQ